MQVAQSRLIWHFFQDFFTHNQTGFELIGWFRLAKFDLQSFSMFPSAAVKPRLAHRELVKLYWKEIGNGSVFASLMRLVLGKCVPSLIVLECHTFYIK